MPLAASSQEMGNTEEFYLIADWIRLMPYSIAKTYLTWYELNMKLEHLFEEDCKPYSKLQAEKMQKFLFEPGLKINLTRKESYLPFYGFNGPPEFLVNYARYTLGLPDRAVQLIQDYANRLEQAMTGFDASRHVFVKEARVLEKTRQSIKSSVADLEDRLKSTEVREQRSSSELQHLMGSQKRMATQVRAAIALLKQIRSQLRQDPDSLSIHSAKEETSLPELTAQQNRVFRLVRSNFLNQETFERWAEIGLNRQWQFHLEKVEKQLRASMGDLYDDVSAADIECVCRHFKGELVRNTWNAIGCNEDVPEVADVEPLDSLEL